METGAKKTEQALQESENILQAIIENAVEGIITIDYRGNIETFNSAAFRLFGYTADEVIGKNIKMLMPEPDRSKHDGYLHNYQETGHAKIIGIGREVVAMRKDGTKFQIYLSISEVKLHDRIIYTGLVRDISAQKEAEDRLRRYAAEVEELNRNLEIRVEERTIELEKAMKALNNSKEELQKALEKEKELNDLKSKFITIASHEFRTPLTTILSSAALISKYKHIEEDDKRQKHIDRIKSSVQNLTEILNDFLSLSKLEEGVIKSKDTTFELDLFCHELAEEMSGNIKKGQQIVCDHLGTLTEVNLDKQLLRNVIINLLSNAIKFSNEDSLIVLSSFIGKQIQIKIQDHGIGIPESDQKYLFERFFRASNANNVQGTGLGLHIVKKYVELMNGNIALESTYGKGTTFTITLKSERKS